jgi:8-oxo-dGTP pyrophosphatase MutT (NUDIX family)
LTAAGSAAAGSSPAGSSSAGSSPGRSPAAVPDWLTPLVTAAGQLVVPAQLRPPAEGGRPSAVLVLFGAGADGPDLLLVQRSAQLRNHPGQPAFPGGSIDAADGGPVRAALREAAEETGVDPAGVRVLAVLPELYIPRSGFVVTPVIGWWQTPGPVSAVDTAEIAAVHRVPVAELARPANRIMIAYPDGRGGPAFRVAGLLVWGFTAALIDQLLTLGGWQQPWDRDSLTELPAEAQPVGWPRPNP